MNAPRIIKGRLKNRKINVPKGLMVRPTSARLREAVFNMIGQEIEDAVFLDICSGSGAMALEALSRGASTVYAVEHDRDVTRYLQQTFEETGLKERFRLLQEDARYLRQHQNLADFVYIDPPYKSNLLTEILQSLSRSGWLGISTRIYAECHAKTDTKVPDGYELLDQRRYGIANLLILAVLEDQSSSSLSQ